MCIDRTNIIEQYSQMGGEIILCNFLSGAYTATGERDQGKKKSIEIPII